MAPMRNGYILASLLVLSCVSVAQQSAFQSADGQTSIYLDQPAAILNLGDSKASYGYTDRHSEQPKYWGFEVFAKASSGVTNLFSSDKPKIPEGGGDFTFGFHDPFRLSSDRGKFVDDWILVDGGYSRSYFYVSSLAGPVDQANRYFDRFRTVVVYNGLVNGWFLFGIAGGAERRNNLTDLKQVTFQTILAQAPSPSDATIVKSQSGFFGNYRQYIAAPVYTDLLFMLPPKKPFQIPGLNNQIGIDAFTRSDLAATNRSSDGGVGIFLTQKGAPTKVVGGVSASWNGGKVQVAVVAGFNFK